MLQQQKQRELPTKKARLHPLEIVLGWLSLLFGSAGFLYFWIFFAPLWRENRWDVLAARATLLLGVLLATLAGGFVLCRARRLARWLLHGAGLFAVLVLGYAVYDIWLRRSSYRDELIAIAGIAAATFWIFWFAWFIKKQEGET
ncbi:hypothetical protein [Armatimonas sp.]|uniref:hypothetical protein n=1 Tax=Armatimonas sp. TaxID=1872638 RepID=UPI00286A855A|nr:hypothetical protein [Armatimonas sp.]